MIKVYVNGDSKVIEDDVNLEELVESLDLAEERVAVEVNKDVVRRKDWCRLRIRNNDKVEIIHFVGGG